jgi:AcrR family transcriptional regulator
MSAVPELHAITGHRHGRVPRSVREQQLLNIAEEFFAQRGYDATSIEDIARTAQVSRPIVYEHFGSKEGIYLACVRRARADFEQDLLKAVSASTSLRDQLDRGGHAFFAVLERDPRRWAILFGMSAPLQGAFGEELNQLRFATVARIAAILVAHTPDADPERIDAFAHAISGVGEQLGRWWLAHPDVPLERVAAHFRDFAWAGSRQLLSPAAE